MLGILDTSGAPPREDQLRASRPDDIMGMSGAQDFIAFSLDPLDGASGVPRPYGGGTGGHGGAGTTAFTDAVGAPVPTTSLDPRTHVFFVSPRGAVLSHKQNSIGQSNNYKKTVKGKARGGRGGRNGGGDR